MSDDLQIYQCPKCGKRLHARRGAANRKARCPACGEIHVIPGEEDPFAVGQAELPRVQQAPEQASPFGFFEDRSAADDQALARQPQEQPDGGLLRRCPRCGRQVRAPDPWVEVVCRSCGAPVPAVAGSDEQGRAGDEVAAIDEQVRAAEHRIAAAPPMPGAASLLALASVTLYVEAASLAVSGLLLTVLLAPQQVAAIVPAIVLLVAAGLRAAQSRMLGRRNSMFRLITIIFDGLMIAALIVCTALAIRYPAEMLLPAALWGGLLFLVFLIAALRAYILFYHSRSLFRE